jgi:hypothetical protein
VRDPQPGQVPEPGGLGRQRVRAGDDGLGRDDRRGRGQQDQQQATPGRGQQEERAAHVALIAQDQRALTEVAEHAGREHEQQPGPRDRPTAEVAHVRVERLGAGDREHDRGQGEERDPEVAGEKGQGVRRRQCLEDGRVLGDADHAQHADRGEPRNHHGPEQPPDRPGSPSLHHEEGDDDHRRERHDPFTQ